jgi:hypothetical protein
MEEAAFHDVCVLEDPQKYRHQFQKSWNPKMGEEWRNYLLTVLSEKGLRRIRGIHGRECHLFTFEGEEGALFSVSEALDPETATVTTRVYSTEHDVMNYIEEADRLYNDSRAVRFLEDRS